MDKLCQYDKFWSKYYPERDAYALARNYFIENKQYTHFVIIPDDLYVLTKHFEKLKKGAERYDVIGGCCNIDTWSDKKDYFAVSRTLPSLDRSARMGTYSFIYKGDVDGNIIRCKFNGFVCMFISRAVVEKTEAFNDDNEYNNPGNLGYGGALDVVFANKCDRLGIPIHTDTSVIMEHKPERGRYPLLVGIEKPHMIIEKGVVV